MLCFLQQAAHVHLLTFLVPDKQFRANAALLPALSQYFPPARPMCEARVSLAT